MAGRVEGIDEEENARRTWQREGDSEIERERERESELERDRERGCENERG